MWEGEHSGVAFCAISVCVTYCSLSQNQCRTEPQSTVTAFMRCARRGSGGTAGGAAGASLTAGLAQHFASVVGVILPPAAASTAAAAQVAAVPPASSRAARVSHLLSGAVTTLAIPAGADARAAATLAVAGYGLLFRRNGAILPHTEAGTAVATAASGLIAGASAATGQPPLPHETEVLQAAHLLRWMLCRCGVALPSTPAGGAGVVVWRLPEQPLAPSPPGVLLHNSALPVAWDAGQDVSQARLAVMAARAWMLIAAQATVPVPRSLLARLPTLLPPEADAMTASETPSAGAAPVPVPIVALPGLDCAHIFRTAVTPVAGGSGDATDDLYPGKALLLGPDAVRTGRRWLASM